MFMTARKVSEIRLQSDLPIVRYVVKREFVTIDKELLASGERPAMPEKNSVVIINNEFSKSITQ